MLKLELQAKFLQHLNRKKKNEEGFTLIELLVVVIIIGILAAIALPSLLGQVNKAKQAEAKNNIGAVNRAQQAYFLENQQFAATLSDLQAGIQSQTDNFSYSINGGGSGKGTAQIKADIVTGKVGLKSYYGIAGTQLGNAATSEALTVAIACEALTPGSDKVPDTEDLKGCHPKYKSLAR
ncbi:MAG: type IV pilin-like G/H family protein [Hassallia sp. WJT32-NPBG1]|jgi:type IV pilus assembly protein PilA|nr:type IV pilin-like G/H family protein [Hassallia sp. WJT32-NPBG1]